MECTIKNENYIDLNVGNKIVKIRQWKVKDRNKLKERLLKYNEDKSINIEKEIIDILLRDCCDKEYALNADEIQFVFNNIRGISISDEIDFKYECKNCKKLNTKKLNINSINKPKFGELKDITLNASMTDNSQNDVTIKLSEIKNVEYYNKIMFNSTDPLLDDFILHISEYCGDNSLSFENLKDIFMEYNTKDLDYILEQYEKMIFSLDRKVDLRCSDCKEKNSFIFDEIPDFLPKEWLGM